MYALILWKLNRPVGLKRWLYRYAAWLRFGTVFRFCKLKVAVYYFYVETEAQWLNAKGCNWNRIWLGALGAETSQKVNGLIRLPL